jgi:hypothetical protein
MARKKKPEIESSLNLAREISRLSKTLTKLEASINRLAAGGRGVPGGARGGFPRGGGVPGRGAAGAGIGRMGAALPIAGALIGAFGFALSKVTEIGRAYIQKTMQQYGTAGVGGFQRTGRFLGTFSAAEYGAYEKEKRMAAGRFDLGLEEYRGLTKTDIRYNKKGEQIFKSETPTLGIQATGMFAMGTQMGRLAGLGRAMLPQQQSGEAFVDKIIRGIVEGQRGLTTELPFIISEVTKNMEDAVREGVSSSTMAVDMAKELAVMGRGTLTGQARSAARTQKSLNDLMGQVGRNQGAGPAQFQMRLAARDIILGRDERSQKAQRYLMDAGIISPEDLKKGLSPAQMRTAVQFLGQSRFQAVKERFVERVVPRYAGEGTVTERFSRFHKIAQDAGISTDVTHSMDIFKKYERKQAPLKLHAAMERREGLERDLRTAQSRERAEEGQGFFGDLWSGITRPFRKSSDDINKELQSFDRTLESSGPLSLQKLYAESMGIDKKRGISAEQEFRRAKKATGFGTVEAQKLVKGSKEAMLMGEVGQKAAETVNTIDRAFMNMAKDMAGPVAKNIGTLTNTIETLAKTAAGAMKKMKGLIREFRSISKHVAGFEKKGVSYLGEVMAPKTDPAESIFLERSLKMMGE